MRALRKKLQKQSFPEILLFKVAFRVPLAYSE